MSAASPSAPLTERLQRYGQEHLLRWWGELTSAERERFAAELERVDFERIAGLCRGRAEPAGRSDETPADKARRAASPRELIRLQRTKDEREEWRRAERRGRELLSSGKVGAILVAGGQGTRLGFPHPKGMFAIGPVSGKSLFQLFFESLQARSRSAGATIPYYIMTSDATHEETVAFLEAHRYFGSNPRDVRIFRQGNMPAADAATGRLLLEEKGRLSLSPDGHGGLLEALSRQDLLEDMRSRGIEFLYYHQVDNPTAIICDPVFLGFHELRRSSVSTKVVAKRSPEEKMGVAVEVDGRTQIIEYSDLPDEVARRTDTRGNLELWAGSTAMHVFSRAFLQELIDTGNELPFHLAHKKVPYLDENGRPVEPEEPNALKFERFIFDVLPRADCALVLEADRGREFNPVKNADGADSPKTSRAALVALHREWLLDASARIGEDVPVEISPLFAQNSDELRKKLKPGAVFDRATYLEPAPGEEF